MGTSPRAVRALLGRRIRREREMDQFENTYELIRGFKGSSYLHGFGALY
jgi:hypothetical protein